MENPPMTEAGPRLFWRFQRQLHTEGVGGLRQANFSTFAVDLPAPMVYHTENGANDPANPLIAGYELVYLNAAAAPAAGCRTGLGAWLPVLDAASAGGPNGVVAPGTGISVAVIMPTGAESTYAQAPQAR